MAQDVKEQARAVLYDEDGGNFSLQIAVRAVDALAAAGLLLDERSQACVEACKEHRRLYPQSDQGGRQRDPFDACAKCTHAGRAYDAPKRTREQIVAALVTWHRATVDIESRAKLNVLLDELAALERKA